MASIEKNREYKRRYKEKYPERVNAAQRKYRKEHREQFKAYELKRLETRRKYKEKYQSEYYKKHQKELNFKENIRHKTRLKTDPIYAIQTRLRRRLNHFIAQDNGKKYDTTEHIIGCGWEELKQHLESKFYPHPDTKEPMTWENRSEWHIDHIIPCKAFNSVDEEDQRRCFNYTNLQPLWKTTNLKKGSKI